MASEPVDILQRMIIDLRKRVDGIDERLQSLDRIEAKLDDLTYLVNNALGFAAANHLRTERLSEEVSALGARVTRLEANA